MIGLSVHNAQESPANSLHLETHLVMYLGLLADAFGPTHSVTVLRSYTVVWNLGWF